MVARGVWQPKCFFGFVGADLIWPPRVRVLVESRALKRCLAHLECSPLTLDRRSSLSPLTFTPLPSTIADIKLTQWGRMMTVRYDDGETEENYELEFQQLKQTTKVQGVRNV